jgi:hypothetical protein
VTGKRDLQKATASLLLSLEKTRTNNGKKKKSNKKKLPHPFSLFSRWSGWRRERKADSCFVLMAMFVFLGPKVFNISNQQHKRRTLSIRSFDQTLTENLIVRNVLIWRSRHKDVPFDRNAVAN